jgi:hypothetical protein
VSRAVGRRGNESYDDYQDDRDDETGPMRLREPETSPGRRGGRDRSSRVAWWVTFTILSTLGGLWALSGPVFSVPDEPAHAVYAAAIVRGEFFAPTEGIDTTVTVPATYADAATVGACFIYDGAVPAGCAEPYVTEPGTAEVVTTAGRYPPAYYLYAGAATLVSDGATALYLMRLLTVVLCAGLLASAFSSARDMRSPWPPAGVVLAITPMVLFFTGAANPQGPELAAGIGLWSSGLALLTLAERDRGRLSSRLLVRTLVAAAVLGVIRPMSIVWLALIVGVVLLARASAPSTRALFRHKWAVLGGFGVAVLVGASAVWIVYRDALQQWSRPNDAPFVRAAQFSVSKLDMELHEMVGVFGWLDTWAPGVVYVIWFGAVGALAVFAFAAGNRRERLALAGIVVVSLVMPVFSELTSYRQSSFAWQGRYILAFSVGLTILSGFVLIGKVPPGLATRVCRGLVYAAAFAQVVAFIGNLNRYVHGVHGFWFIDEPAWRPPVPDVLLVGAFVVTTAVGAVLLARSMDERNARPEVPAARSTNVLV